LENFPIAVRRFCTRVLLFFDATHGEGTHSESTWSRWTCAGWEEIKCGNNVSIWTVFSASDYDGVGNSAAVRADFIHPLSFSACIFECICMFDVVFLCLCSTVHVCLHVCIIVRLCLFHFLSHKQAPKFCSALNILCVCVRTHMQCRGFTLVHQYTRTTQQHTATHCSNSLGINCTSANVSRE